MEKKTPTNQPRNQVNQPPKQSDYHWDSKRAPGVLLSWNITAHFSGLHCNLKQTRVGIRPTPIWEREQDNEGGKYYHPGSLKPGACWRGWWDWGQNSAAPWSTFPCVSEKPGDSGTVSGRGSGVCGTREMNAPVCLRLGFTLGATAACSQRQEIVGCFFLFGQSCVNFDLISSGWQVWAMLS